MSEVLNQYVSKLYIFWHIYSAFGLLYIGTLVSYMHIINMKYKYFMQSYTDKKLRNAHIMPVIDRSNTGIYKSCTLTVSILPFLFLKGT